MQPLLIVAAAGLIGGVLIWIWGERSSSGSTAIGVVIGLVAGILSGDSFVNLLVTTVVVVVFLYIGWLIMGIIVSVKRIAGC